VGIFFKNPLRAKFKKEFFSSLPQKPGVYFMKCRAGEIIYIGKATCLRSRVRSYCNARPGKVGKNIIKLLKHVERIEWEEHESEKAAYSRELELIRAFVPKYNIADAWEERYYFIGLKIARSDRLEFRLTMKEEDNREFTLHGCYPRRGDVKRGYSAMIRILFAIASENQRFSFPAKISRPYPAYNYSLKIAEVEKWEKMISSFLHGKPSKFMQRLVECLLLKENIPEYMRPGIQRDILALRHFEKACLEARWARGEVNLRALSHEELRLQIQSSIRVNEML
jgi:excinuclease UvrABC nuclease subunit